MKTTLSPQASPVATPGHPVPGNQDGNAPNKQDRNARLAFYFLMSTLAAGLLYFLLLPFFL